MGSSFIIHHSSFIIHHSSFVIRHSSFVIPNSSFAMRLPLTVCREGWAYLFMLAIVLAGAVLRDINLLILVAGLMAGPIAINVVAVLIGLRKLDVRRTAPDVVSAGDLVVAEITLDNRRRWLSAWMIVVADTIERIGGSGHGEKISASVVFALAPAGESRRATYRGHLTQRGRYRLGPLRVWTRFPLGLVRHTRWLNHEATVIVCPRVGRLKFSTRPVEREALTSGAHARRRGVTEGDFHGLRDWRPGDSQRWIHWRTTARRGDLVVRQFEQQQNQDLTLFLELWQPPQATAKDMERVELAIRFTATVLDDACRRGAARLTLLSTGEPAIDCRGPAGSGVLAEMLRALAVVQPVSTDELPAAFSRGAQEARDGSVRLMVTTREAPLDLEAIEASPTPPIGRLAAQPVQVVSVASHEFNELFDGS
jgi:uncharacterized protein (DUF58 family)